MTTQARRYDADISDTVWSCIDWNDAQTYGTRYQWSSDYISGNWPSHYSLPTIVESNQPQNKLRVPKDSDRAMIARGDDLLHRDPTRYWGDLEFQDAVFEGKEEAFLH